MKAFKEKRASFRSLLRRSLVILSLFALAFAVSCGDSDTGDGGNYVPPPPNGGGETTPPPPAKVANFIRVLSQPLSISYEGLPPDLSGLVVEVWFDDGSYELISDPSQFYTFPRLATQADEGEWGGLTNLGEADPAPRGAVGSADGTGPEGRIEFTITNKTIKPIRGDSANPPTLNDPKYRGYKVFHLTSAQAGADVTLELVRPMFGTPGDGTLFTDLASDQIANREGLQITGRLTQQNIFEDDVINFAGLNVEAVYPAINWGTGNTYEIHSSIRSGGNAFIPEARREIKLSMANLDRTNQGTYIEGTTVPTINYYPGINPNEKLVYIDVAGRKWSASFTNWYDVRGLKVSKVPTYRDYFQYDATYVNWAYDLFAVGGLELEVLYGGTAETKKIGWQEWSRATAERRAMVVVPPDRFARDLDGVNIRLGYFYRHWDTIDNTLNPGLVGPDGSWSNWIGGVGEDTLQSFPNQVLDLPVKVLEFQGELAFQPKANQAHILPLAIHGWGDPADAADPSANPPKPLVRRQRVMPAGVINAIQQTYDLVALYEDGKVKTMNGLIWGGADTPGTSSGITTGAPVNRYRWSSNGGGLAPMGRATTAENLRATVADSTNYITVGDASPIGVDRSSVPGAALAAHRVGTVSIDNWTAENYERTFRFTLPSQAGSSAQDTTHEFGPTSWTNAPTDLTNMGGDPVRSAFSGSDSTQLVHFNGIVFDVTPGLGYSGELHVRQPVSETQAWNARRAFRGLRGEIELINVLPRNPVSPPAP